MRFIEIDGHIIAEDAIEMIKPAKDGNAYIRFKSGEGHVFSAEAVEKLKRMLTVHPIS